MQGCLKLVNIAIEIVQAEQQHARKQGQRRQESVFFTPYSGADGNPFVLIHLVSITMVPCNPLPRYCPRHAPVKAENAKPGMLSICGATYQYSQFDVHGT